MAQAVALYLLPDLPPLTHTGTLYQRLRQLELPLQLRERGGCAEGSQGASRGSNSAGNGSDSSSSSTSMPGLTPVTAAECANAADEEETTGPCTGSGLQDAELLRLLELNCFSEPRMDPGVTVGSAAAGVPAAGPGQAEELPSEGCSHLAVDKLPAVDFLRLAVGDAGGGDGSGGNGGSGEGGDGGASQGGCRWLSRPGHTGLWVEHAWMNHSCAPNVVNYVLGESMVVRGKGGPGFGSFGGAVGRAWGAARGVKVACAFWRGRRTAIRTGPHVEPACI